MSHLYVLLTNQDLLFEKDTYFQKMYWDKKRCPSYKHRELLWPFLAILYTVLFDFQKKKKKKESFGKFNIALRIKL